MATAPQKVTEDQANAALQQLVGVDANGEEVQPEPVTEPAPAVAEPPVEEPAEAAAETAPSQEVAETDDVQSLKKRLEAVDAERKRDQESTEKRLRDMQERNAANERILRDRLLRKSSITDKALRTLRAVRTAEGVPEAEVDRIIAELQGTMNPASSSYAPPPETHMQASEDQILTLNQFLNEKGMDAAEADQFGKWIRADAVSVLTPQEQAVAEHSLDGFLRLAHERWKNGLRETEAANRKREADAAAAVRATQRIQKDAARAASIPASSPKRSPAAPKTEAKKLTKDEVSELLRQSVLHAND